MTLVELKKSIHEKVDNLNDADLLEIVNDLLVKKDDVFVIPQYMKEGIKQGSEDFKNGDVYTINDFEEKYERWLKK